MPSCKLHPQERLDSLTKIFKKAAAWLTGNPRWAWGCRGFWEHPHQGPDWYWNHLLGSGFSRGVIPIWSFELLLATACLWSYVLQSRLQDHILHQFIIRHDIFWSLWFSVSLEDKHISYVIPFPVVSILGGSSFFPRLGLQNVVRMGKKRRFLVSGSFRQFCWFTPRHITIVHFETHMCSNVSWQNPSLPPFSVLFDGWTTNAPFVMDKTMMFPQLLQCLIPQSANLQLIPCVRLMLDA